MVQSKQLHELLESAISAFKASVSVILVLLYGYLLRKWNYITKPGESNISKVSTTFFLPALLFTEIGPLATWTNLKEFWPIIPVSLAFQVLSLIVGELSKLAGLPQHYVPIFVFNNVTSLPLLLIKALATTGSLDGMVPKGDTLDATLKRGTVYVLINALVGNLTRFALGPYLMQTHKEEFWAHPHLDDPHEEAPPKLFSQIRLPVQDEPAEPTWKDKAKQGLYHALDWVWVALNPPLIGGVLAVTFGIIPFFHHHLFDPSGWLTPIASSVASLGNLYTALQMAVLGAHLYSKKGRGAKPVWVIWLFLWRFFLAPAVSINTISFIRNTWPTLIDTDPIFDFVLMISNVGPPALTLSAIAEMADLPAEIEGQISQIITLSYVVTPLIAFPVTAALEVVEANAVGRV
ncbi:hypothetical protein T439DRAFT_324841 [Meredithblackwellia eburnea MCA 4105]